MKKEIAETILFTGAGFTKNFGGLLAKEIWSKIFNHDKVQNQPQLKSLLMEDYDYESIYYKVIGGDYEKDEKDAIEIAVFETYQILDDIVREWISTNNSPYPVNIYEVNKLIERFAGEKHQLGFFFTLNQDLFIERHFNSHNTSLIHPGVSRIPDNHKIIMKYPLENQDYALLPTKDRMEDIAKNQLFTQTFHYIKLHGSYGWKSSDGSNRLVIGKNKEDQIAKEPILAWYFELFKEVILKDKRKLFVIGYGFSDDHINEVIADSITQHGLKIYVLSPTEQAVFIKQLNGIKHGKEILSGLSGYFPYKLLEVFPSDQSESHAWREIKERYFMN